jgi:hypothetical protein
MASKTGICNMALLKVGAERITTLGDGSTNDLYCTEIYAATVDEVLRMHPWNCALHRKELTALAATPAFKYAYQYTLPPSPYCLRVLQMENIDEKFKVEGRVLLTNESTCKILYIKRIVNTAEFDPLLVEAIVTRLAFKLAYPITQSRTLRDSLADELAMILSEARSTDAQEGTPDELDTSTWLDSRY